MMDGEKEKFKSQKYKNLYMDLALRIAEMSHAKRLKVGSVIVKNNNIISFGWNGMPSGWDNNCEIEISQVVDIDNRTITPSQTVTRPEVLHSEQNALMKLCRSTYSSDDAQLFTTHTPCLQCAKLIYQSGIKSVFFRNEYRDSSGVEFLKKCKVEVNKI